MAGYVAVAYLKWDALCAAAVLATDMLKWNLRRVVM